MRTGELGKCLICGKEVCVFPSDVKLGWGKYCSRTCRGKAEQTGEYRNCFICGTRFYVSLSRLKHGGGKYCSNACKGQSMREERGPNSRSWKGGVKRNDGYLYVLSHNHPAACYGYVLQHRLVMEQKLGRYLKPEEVVHHENEDRADNRLENLRLFSSNSGHIEHHYEERKRND